MKVKLLFLFLTISIVFSSCSKKPEGTPGKNEIWLEYKAFNPTQLTVAVGTTVVFTNKDNADHTVTDYGHSFDSGRIQSGITYSYTFNTAGTYYFYCKYHTSGALEQGAILVH